MDVLLILNEKEKTASFFRKRFFLFKFYPKRGAIFSRKDVLFLHTPEGTV